MNKNGIVNRIEILLYGSLISVMSEINDLRGQIHNLARIPKQNSTGKEIRQDQMNAPADDEAISISLNSIQQVLLPLVLWIILGFAAGFLIGMIKPW